VDTSAAARFSMSSGTEPVLRRMLSSWKKPKPVPGSGMFQTNFRRTLWLENALRSTIAGG